ncbi:DUF1573 domain-containing protein [Dysgonomonas sp. 216]|uniref:DUF1573 domain-containing protein n=1 Tax=Dysgonomonas sp. 216 TaxID=2302934 RepID=UPI0013D42D0D|nr:DUF1573 domain-containing protein [Dysgonomonas sp. 216]NDW18484.1 DUF1573 domain-containing protein [Dysgonomonas sp. 216]
MKTRFFKCAYLGIFVVVLLSSCNIRDKKTTIEIDDPNRHYYPIQRGQSLEILYEIKNTGNNPLFITDIHTSCGCILIDESSFKVLPAGANGFLKLKYDSRKNVGYVKHYIDIYANLETNNLYSITFDLNVVPNALYTRDYEELYNEHKAKNMGIETLVDGDTNNKGYYVENIP